MNTDSFNSLERLRRLPLYDFILSTGMKDLQWTDATIRFIYPKTGQQFDYYRLAKKVEDHGLIMTNPIEFGREMLGMNVIEILNAIKAGGTQLPETIKPMLTRFVLPEYANDPVHLPFNHIKAVADGELRHIPKKMLKEIVTPVASDVLKGIQKGYMFKNDNGSQVLNFSNRRTLTIGAPDVLTIRRSKQTLDVYETMGDYLSHRVFSGDLRQGNSVMVFTDINLFEHSRPTMERYKQINLYLPNQPHFREYKEYAQWLDPARYLDRSKEYRSSISLLDQLNEKLDKKKTKQSNRFRL